MRAGPVERSRTSSSACCSGWTAQASGSLSRRTGWLPHSTRAALTRLRQSGHDLQKEKRDTGETLYRIAAPARVARSRKAA